MSAAMTESSTANYDVHPAATLFPLMTGTDFTSLVEDIRVRGQEQPVVLDRDGRLLDGRNRARACQALGIDVKETRYDGDDPFGFVLSHNLHRRHLNESQRAMVAAKLANLTHGGDRSSDGKCSKEHLNPVPTEAAAKALNVSVASVRRARVVRDHGSVETQRAVESGRLPVTRAAAEISKARAAQHDPAPAPAPAPAPRVARGVAAEVRVRQITELAEKGATSDQIGKELGIDGQTVRTLANRHEITIRADKVRGKVRRIDYDRVLDNITVSLETAAFGLRDIDGHQLDREATPERLDSLTSSINALTKALKKIKESFHDEG